MFFRKKEKKEEKVEELFYPITNITGNDVLNGTCPWGITKDDNNYYIISIFLFDKDNQWHEFTSYSEQIIGVKKEEFLRLAKEKFNAITISLGWNDSKYIAFERIEDAVKMIEEFKTYYDSFYMPHAILNRLSCYIEGGYPPYFKENKLKKC